MVYVDRSNYEGVGSMSGVRWSDEKKAWYFKNVVEAGIPPRGKKALEMMKNKFGAAPSKSTLQYWVVPEEKEKLAARTKKYRAENVTVIVGSRLDQFKKHTPPITTEVPVIKKLRAKERGVHPTLIFTINNRITRFNAKGMEMDKVPLNSCNFLAKDLLEHMKTTQKYNEETEDCICIICGDTLNLVRDTWHMDHIDPYGDNSVKNASCVHSKCNQMKSYLSMEELISLARKMVSYQDSKKEWAGV